jgi:DNA mismatch endonuclease (patch repair protein)
MPVRNREWWETKFSAIKHRDADTVQRLVDAGWMPHIVWEHEDPLAAASRIVELHDSLRRRTGS